MIADKSYNFALRVIKLYKWLTSEQKEFVLSKQLLRSGTAIGALVKEANETEYWLMLLKDSDFLSEKEFTSIHTDSVELIKLLISIVKTTKQILNK